MEFLVSLPAVYFYSACATETSSQSYKLPVLHARVMRSVNLLWPLLDRDHCCAVLSQQNSYHVHQIS